MNKLRGPIMRLQVMRTNSVVIDTSDGLIYFPQMTMQVIPSSTETTAKPQPVFTVDVLTTPPKTTKATQRLPIVLRNGTQQVL